MAFRLLAFLVAAAQASWFYDDAPSKPKNEKINMVMIGNPGTGKSTLINCYSRQHLFRSSDSLDGQGITFQLDTKEHEGVKYHDTPGLADINLREQAAKAIDKALQQGGLFRIIFVITTEAGRLKSDDLTTIKLVTDALNGMRKQLIPDGFAIFVNKCEQDWLDRFDERTWLRTLTSSLQRKAIPTTRHVHFAPMNEHLKGVNDTLVDLPNSTRKFLDKVPVIHVSPDHVKEVNFKAFEEMQMLVEEAQVKARRAEEELQKQHAAAERAKQQAEEEVKRANEEAEAKRVEAENAEKRAQEARAKAEAAEAQFLLDKNNIQAKAEAEAAQVRQQFEEAQYMMAKKLADEAKKAEQAKEEERAAKAEAKKKIEDTQSKERLVANLLHGDLASFNFFGMGFIPNLQHLVLKVQEVGAAYRVVIWKGGSYALSVATGLAATNRVNGYAVFDKSGKVLKEDGAPQFRDKGAWMYSIDAENNRESWTLSDADPDWEMTRYPTKNEL